VSDSSKWGVLREDAARTFDSALGKRVGVRELDRGDRGQKRIEVGKLNVGLECDISKVRGALGRVFRNGRDGDTLVGEPRLGGEGGRVKNSLTDIISELLRFETLVGARDRDNLGDVDNELLRGDAVGFRSASLDGELVIRDLLPAVVIAGRGKFVDVSLVLVLARAKGKSLEA